jgi:hypothetical protein
MLYHHTMFDLWLLTLVFLFIQGRLNQQTFERPVFVDKSEVWTVDLTTTIATFH